MFSTVSLVGLLCDEELCALLFTRPRVKCVRACVDSFIFERDFLWRWKKPKMNAKVVPRGDGGQLSTNLALLKDPCEFLLQDE